MRNLYRLAAVTIVLGSLVTGCASHRTTREETVRYEQPAPGDQTNTPPVVERDTTVTDTPEHRGILGGTVDFIGSVLAFPFRVIAGAIETIL